MYPIEVLTTDSRLSGPLDQAMNSLNGIQREFFYHRPPHELEQLASVLDSPSHSADKLFAWLKGYREGARGHRPYLILIVKGRLTTVKYSNAFGSHDASDGLALFTVHDQARFVADTVRYLRYYLVRYTLSFVGPGLKSHADDRGCFFDRKEYKPSIATSMRTGGLCDQHITELIPFLSASVKAALDQLRARVAEDVPYALVMKGGGVKGLALVGALEVLSERVSFDTFAGTSAGAIAAVLLAAGYSPAELRRELYDLNFNEFRAEGPFRQIVNAVFKKGRFSADALQDWVDRRVTSRVNLPPPIKLGDLTYHVVLYSCSAQGLIVFDGRGSNKEVPASFAARCSASIPGFFAPQMVNGVYAFDGGMRANFPLTQFIRTYQQKPILGLYLSPPRKSGRIGSQLIDAQTTGEEPDLVRQYAKQIVVIDPSPIRTTDFNLTPADKDFLLDAGRVAAHRFLADTMPDEALPAGKLQTMTERNSKLRQAAAQRWRRDL